MPGLLAFHAHPDDESISMGATLARYAAAGEEVVVVTATGGEVGEIHNHDDPAEIAPRLGEVRAAELRHSLNELGVEHHEFLGYRDSGMMGTEDNGHRDAFWQADFMEATGRLVSLIRRYRPEVVTAYDPFGGYGHPDHIQVHRVGTAAFFGADDAARFPPESGTQPWAPAKLYWATFPRTAIEDLRRAAEGEGAEPRADGPPVGSLDQDITTWIHAPEFAEAKQSAVLAHRTQIPPDSWFRRLPEQAQPDLLGRESFTLVFSRIPVDLGEGDLFAGLR